MRNDAEKIAVIDIGSNSVRLFIFSVEDELPQQLYAKKYFCGLGRDLATTGLLNAQAAELALGYLESFREELKKHELVDELVIGTAALREARDAEDFLTAARTRSGFDITIIDGFEEARLAALAILSTDKDANGVVADFGGGSLELAKIGAGKIEDKISLRLGAHYLKALPDRVAGIQMGLLPLNDHKNLKTPSVLYVIGGSWRSLANAWMISNGRLDHLEGLRIDPADIIPFCKEIQGKEPDELIGRYHMEVPRAHLMDVSAQMLEALIVELQPLEIQVSMAGIRDGLAYDYIIKRKAA